MNINLGNAAHAFGADNYTEAEDPFNPGSRLGVTYSQPLSTWQVGQTLTQTTTYSGGVTAVYIFGRPSSKTLSMDLVDIHRSDNGQSLLWVSGGAEYPYNIEDSSFGGIVLAGADILTGNDFDNVLQGGGGNDTLHGGRGTDTAIFNGQRAQYTVSRAFAEGNFTVTGPDGTDTLVNMERLRFDDLTIAYDTAGTAGQAWRLYQAAFNRAPDPAGLGFQVNALAHSPAAQVATNLMQSPEFSALYGTLDNTGFITQLYTNALHRPADAAGLAYYLQQLGSGANTRADVLIGFAESPENQAALVGTMAQGMVYTG